MGKDVLNHLALSPPIAFPIMGMKVSKPLLRVRILAGELHAAAFQVAGSFTGQWEVRNSINPLSSICKKLLARPACLSFVASRTSAHFKRC